MKLKFLIPMSLSIIALPSITLMSCSNQSMSAEERAEQTNWVYLAAQEQRFPEPIIITPSGVKNIGDINKSHINGISNKKGENLLYEILNFEIPLVDVKDTNVNVKVSSKLDETIYQTYSFKLSKAVTNIAEIPVMDTGTFKLKLDEVYFNDYSNAIMNDISIRIKEVSNYLDISEKFIDPASKELKDIFAEASKEKLETFQSKVTEYISSTVINKLNSIALQKNIAIKSLIIKPSTLGSSSAGIIAFEISFGEKSLYNFPGFLVDTFSNNYSNLEKELININDFEVIKIKEIPVTLPVPEQSLSEYFGVQIGSKSTSNDKNKDFIIDFQNTLSKGTNKEPIRLSIFSKKYPERIQIIYEFDEVFESLKIGEETTLTGKKDYLPFVYIKNKEGKLWN